MFSAFDVPSERLRTTARRGCGHSLRILRIQGAGHFGQEQLR
jgi:hypothetical protein